ncbi:glycosidase [Aquimarina sp. EL_43]|uniref:alpha-amylase family glycosyl hydrolase n=1 Tax=unclassified Aquimarina TaxID=2627091 RepID=UPI0018C974D1|nr:MULTISPECIES: alpha-amylase family glycosyl hydrolase [unclassified Aquimarina]MBG6132191.1 glycosidase [Aquimarina sp. EL_35]MBG6152988.1 glycosidase [Aquimarina sp. EL_32]MBG6170995.1 glycosidase [Aquimarina sp. EL_43]
MKKIILSLTVIGILFSCGKTTKEETTAKTETQEVIKEALPPVSDAMMENAVIYEANIRQYSEEGTFSAFTKDIPVLKKMGVKVLWIMPIYPISTTKSKGSLGSYYAVSDYTKVNPEFGTIEDFRALVKTAHDNGIYVILDWVANHTGWDHIWLKEHPEYYTKDKNGAITHTEGTDWTDVADLNYDNQEMREQMKNDMLYWLKEEGVDGFRCDVAGMVPVDFWNKTIAEFKKIKPVFMLAEGWEPELLENAFDMGYGWDTHHKMNDIAQGKANVTEWDKRMAQIDTMYAKDDILMNFTSNHDENSWNGTVEERMGDAKEMLAALTYLAPGMPLIYSGQEYDMDKRLLFFEKDTIIKKQGKFFPLYEKLGALKNTNPALHGGKNAASYTRIKTSDDTGVLAFLREKDGHKVIFIANMTKEPIKFTLAYEGKFTDYLSGEIIEVSSGAAYEFAAWQYQILIEE